MIAHPGFMMTLSTVILSEIFDKSFFVTMLLSIRYKTSKISVCLGAIAALALVTALSVFVGHLCSARLVASTPYLSWASAGLLAFFGVQSLRAAAAEKKEDAQAEAAEAVSHAHPRRSALLAAFIAILLAELGDRSMLVTISLAATQAPLSVFFGAVLAHSLATVVAVLGGAALGTRRVPERGLALASGILFLGLATGTVMGI